MRCLSPTPLAPGAASVIRTKVHWRCCFDSEHRWLRQRTRGAAGRRRCPITLPGATPGSPETPSTPPPRSLRAYPSAHARASRLCCKGP
jgi:hypothetical protein